ncbi:DUF5688 family protein [Butyrivibrio sp. AE3004]|uniref:DUF5688 family protein n=1 Tax=Butyrivibrio sp. AE3004 TaxID=1506994 RepID=UPI000494A46A|nr:DUF5688 family protein [Butyrivibrio sp. AE3004]
MNYEEFKENLANDVKEQMEARSGSEVTVETRTVEKMNETYDALTVKPEDSIIGVHLNITKLYEEYENGKGRNI